MTDNKIWRFEKQQNGGDIKWRQNKMAEKQNGGKCEICEYIACLISNK